MALPEGAPAKSASAAEWAEYAITQHVPSFEAWNLTKADLIARFEGPDQGPAAGPRVDPQDLGPGHGVGSYMPDGVGIGGVLTTSGDLSVDGSVTIAAEKPAPKKGKANG